METDEIKKAVRERYAGWAKRAASSSTKTASGCGCGTSANASSCCGTSVADAVHEAAASCCGTTASTEPAAGERAAASGGCCSSATGERSAYSREVGYSAEQLAEIPADADLGLGCGNPTAMAGLREGETVVDLGSGGGIDCFLAARRVGPEGRVIGVDMTPEMLELARRNVERSGFGNVEFRLGEIEHLPISDATADVVISNCVINLVPDKAQVFRDVFRVLKPGGRMEVSDIVLLGDIPESIRQSTTAYVACLSGAILKERYLGMIEEAGFTDVRVTAERMYAADELIADEFIGEMVEKTGATEAELREAARLFASVQVHAVRPEVM